MPSLFYCVLPFPAMKIIALSAVIAFVWLTGYHYSTLVPKGTIPAGEVIQKNELTRGWLMSTDKLDLATDPSTVIGHKALKQLPGGSNIHLSDVAPQLRRSNCAGCRADLNFE